MISSCLTCDIPYTVQNPHHNFVNSVWKRFESERHYAPVHVNLQQPTRVIGRVSLKCAGICFCNSDEKVFFVHKDILETLKERRA